MVDLCPQCHRAIAVYVYFSSGYNNYEDEFDYECEHCGAKLRIEVYHQPIFGIELKKESERDVPRTQG